jgi:glycosyltransferase involved in cell wall biosynthesis
VVVILKFSIILPVEHGGNHLYKALISIKDIDFSPDLFEVIVAGSSEEKEAEEIVKKIKDVPLKYIESPCPGKSMKINSACRIAKGDVWCFIDDDCEVFPDYLNKLQEILNNNKNVGVLGGSDKAEDHCSPLELSVECVLTSFLGTGGIRKGGGVDKYYPRRWNMAIPREAAFEAALKDEKGQIYFWNEKLEFHAEMEVAKRIEKTGRNIIYAPELIVKHNRTISLIAFAKKQILGTVMARKIGIYNMPHIMLSLFTLFMTLSPFLSLFSKRIAFTYVMVIFFYILSIIAVTMKGFFKYKKIPMLLYIPLLIMIIHFSKGLTYIYLLIREKL